MAFAFSPCAPSRPTVNDLLGVLSGFGGTGADGTDTNGDNVVDVNDLLQVLSNFGADCSRDGMAGGSDGTELVNCCGGGSSCGFQHCPALGAGQDGCVQPWAMPNGMNFDTDCTTGAIPVSSCTQGTDCGGQIWNDCGTSCPALCGEPPLMMCNMMCNAGFQCPNELSWDAVVGACVRGDECTNQFVLPPGMALGRPFLTAQEAPSTASPIEVLSQAVSDWVGMVGPDGKHNHDGRAGGDYGQEEEF